MTDSTTEFYSTLATIIGLWLSFVTSVSLILLTYIIDKNTNYFTSLREEKRKIYSSVQYIDKDPNMIFSNAISGEFANTKE